MGVSLLRNTDQTIPDATSTNILWNSEEFDLNAMHSLSSNTDRIYLKDSGYF